MKLRRRNSDMLYLPQEIIRNILKRLPVKSLIRFQCVCKHWKNLIKDPSFTADHLQQSSHKNPSLLFEWDNVPWHRCLRLLDCEFQVRKVQKAPLIDSLKGASILGSCNGLLCVEINNESPPSLSLWNPATTAVRHVPRTRTYWLDLFDKCVTGFGFSPIVNDYKIVRTYAKPYDPVNRVKVFSLSRGSWKGIDIGNLKTVKLNSETVTANGAIFWSGVKLGAEEEVEDNIEDEGYEDDVEVVVSFDIAKEVFTVITRPDLDCNADYKLTVYENKLAVLCDIWENGIPALIDLWVLDEGACASGETWSLIKRYNSWSIDSMIIWSNEIVCKPSPSKKHNGKGRNVLYLMNRTTNKLERLVIPHGGPIHRIYNYVESLVSVGDNYIEES